MRARPRARQSSAKAVIIEEQSLPKAQQGGRARELLGALEPRQPEIVATLRHLVEMESPSQDASALGALASHIGREFTRRGATVKLHPAPGHGPHVQADFAGASGKPVLLLGHYDTVWQLGTLKTMPFRLDGQRAYGPGIFDMKAGIAMMLYAVEALGPLPCPVTALLVSDEEIGSQSSRAITESVAQAARAVLVLEPALGLHGACKTARKGVGDFTLRVHGVAAHSGLDFEKGHNAVLELSRQLQRAAGFTDLKRGITVSPNIVRGGSRLNVVPELAEAEVDVRIGQKKDGAYVEKKFRSLKPIDRRCKLEVRGGINRPPLERTREVARLYGMAREIARALGFNLKEAAVGGGSDGNFTSGLGIPTLDGLGGVGEGAHASNESILVNELARRSALIARMIETL